MRRGAGRVQGIVAVCVAGLLACLLPGQAGALPLVGDDTTLEALWPGLLADLGISVSVIPGTGPTPATVNAIGQLVLPITGGNTDTTFLEGTIQHEPTAGLRLTRGANELSLTNLVLDFDVFEMQADVTGTGIGTLSAVSVFEAPFCPFVAGSDPCLEEDGSTVLYGNGLRLLPSALAFVGTALGLDANQLVQLGAVYLAVALPDIREVPEPGTAALLAAGLVALAGRRRRAAT